MKKSKITKIAVFDMDGTLIDTPLPDMAKKVWLEKTGTEWPHVGHWGKAESLDMNVFDMPVVETTIADYKKIIDDPETLVIMMTGRMIKLAQHVEAILHAKGLTFDEYHYNKGGATFDAKIVALEKLLEKYPEVTSIEQWDDRDLHVEGFQAWADGLIADGRLESFKITHVKSGHF